MVNKYHNLIQSLEAIGTGVMKCFGNSMLPRLSNPSTNTYQVFPNYEIGDIVFCKVKGRFIDAHLVTKKKGNQYMITNNHGWENGWTSTVYGKVINSVDNKGNPNPL